VKLKVIIHEEGGRFWAEVPALPSCYSQGSSQAEVLANVREAIACHLDAPAPDVLPEHSHVEEVEL
jgi:predicted RNase H-like HicB family nuclease